MEEVTLKQVLDVVMDLKIDMTEMKQDMSNMKQDMKNMKQDMKNMKQDMKQGFKEVNDRLNVIETVQRAMLREQNDNRWMMKEAMRKIGELDTRVTRLEKNGYMIS